MESVRVHVRFRPKLDDSISNWKPVDQDTLQVLRPTRVEKSEDSVLKQMRKEHTRMFRFDRVFDERTSQEALYEQTAKSLVEKIYNALNVTIFAYGHTGSGKTFTQLGPVNPKSMELDLSGQIGIIPRLLKDVLDRSQQTSEHTEVKISASFLQIYNETLCDLIDPSKKNIRIRQYGSKQKSFSVIENATVVSINSWEQVMEMIQHGFRNRATTSTDLNQVSSRSHAVFIVNIVQNNYQKKTRKSSRVTLVDCAGSENVKQSNVHHESLEEAKNINQSLSTLALVIKSITERAKHIPYRNSLLTKLLSDSLGGNSYTCVYLCCHPSLNHVRNTYNTLLFGQSAKLVKNHPRKNQEMSLHTYKVLVAKLKDKISTLELDKEHLEHMLKEHGVDMNQHVGDMLSSDCDSESEHNEYVLPTYQSSRRTSQLIERSRTLPRTHVQSPTSSEEPAPGLIFYETDEEQIQQFQRQRRSMTQTFENLLMMGVSFERVHLHKHEEKK